MFDYQVIADCELRATFHERLGPCLELGIRSNWFRSLPYSALDRLRIAIDGQPVPEAATLVLCDGVAIPLEDLSAVVDRFWFVLDVLKVLVARPEDCATGTHRVSVSYEMRITDLVLSGHAFTEPAHAEAVMVLR